MLLLNEVKAKPVQEATAGALVLFGVDIRRYVGLCVLASRDEAGEKSLVLFSYQDGEQSFPAIYWPKVAGTLCLELGSAQIVGDPTQLMDASPARAVSAGAISIDPANPRRRSGVLAMCDFTDAKRKSLTASRSLTRDEQGREVLIGLTERETIRYMGYVRRGGSRLKAEREMHKQLEQKHEYARIEAIGVEHTLEMRNPPWA